MDNIIKVIFLSLVEGVTEFLPVSSTGHLIVSKALVNFDSIGAVFEIFIQFGAVLALVAYYRRTLVMHIREFSNSAQIRRFWLMILIGCTPAAVLGFLLDAQIEAYLFSPDVVAASLIVGGLVLLLLERTPRFRNPMSEAGAKVTAITWHQAAIIGIAQSLALIPGASRSGTAIVGAIIAGMNRRNATELSFFLAIPLLGGATLYKFVTTLNTLSADQLALLLLGAALSAVFSWLAIDWLLKFISRHSFLALGYYRIVAGILILLAVEAGLI